MKALGNKTWRNLPNAWGQYTDSAEQLFQIEQSDVGRIDRNHRGHDHSTYTFRASDVGRIIAVYTDHSNWTCWVFSSKETVSQ
jgi:hypothetical protein